MTQIFMLLALYLAVISGPLLGGVAAGFRATKRWVGRRRATSAHSAGTVAAPAAA